MDEKLSFMDELLADITIELTKMQIRFTEEELSSKVKSVIREVMEARNYPYYYTKQMVDDDIQKYYSKIKRIVCYDYTTLGADFEISDSANDVKREYVKRESLFSGILPLSKF